MSGKASRDKGNRGELELMHLIHGARIRGRTLTARKVSRAGYSETDLMVGERCRECFGRPLFCPEDPECLDGVEAGTEEKVEVKRRAQGFIQIDRWLDDNFAVVYRKDRGEWIISMRLKDLIEPAE